MNGDSRNILALNQTCRLIQNECAQLFYNVNSFTIRTGKAGDVHFLLNSFRSRIGIQNATALRSIMIETARFIWTGLPQPRKIESPLTELVLALEQECISHPACEFGVRFSFEFGEGQARYGPYLRRVVRETIDLRHLRASWRRILEGLLAEVTENEAGPHTKAALLFLFFELREWYKKNLRISL